MPHADAVLALRFLKVLSVSLFVAGALGATLPWSMPHALRRRFAFHLAAPGFLLTWASGFVLAGLAGHSFLAPWILASLALSLFALHGVLYSAGKEGRAGAKPFAIVALLLLATIALMVWRPA